ARRWRRADGARSRPPGGGSEPAPRAAERRPRPCRLPSPAAPRLARNRADIAYGAAMKFDLLYELQMPKPHDERSEYRCYHEALEQIVFADQLGYDPVCGL